MGLGLLLCAGITSVVLAVPVVSGADGSPASFPLDASSSSAARPPGSPVVMGLDGGAVSSSTFAGASSSAPAPGTPSATASETTEAAPADVPAPSDTAAAAPEAPVTTSDAATPPPVAEAAPAPSPAPAPGVEGQVLALVNVERAAAGCAPLVADAGLAAVAQAHSADMRDRSFFDHVNPDGIDPFERARQAGQTNAEAENIAYGQPDPAAVMDSWMNSSGHRATILDCELRTLGVGVAEGAGGPWWTQLFGA
ncbi:MAG: CAP domain-containing protein [Blastococcus sp.]